MARLGLKDLRPGMTTGEDVKNFSDEVVLPKGTRLTEKHIHNMKAWGITEVCMEGDSQVKVSPDLLKTLPPEVVEKAKSETSSLFQNANKDHPATLELMRLNLLARLEKKSFRELSHDG